MAMRPVVPVLADPFTAAAFPAGAAFRLDAAFPGRAAFAAFRFGAFVAPFAVLAVFFFAILLSSKLVSPCFRPPGDLMLAVNSAGSE
jgi:hypothetical protein